MTAAKAVLDRIADQLEEHVCILGVGNPHRRDDGAGSRVAADLELANGAVAIDAGTVPENHLEQVARSDPDIVLVVDAVDFGAAPGELRLLDPNSVGLAGLSTHALSLHMAMDYLAARTGARVLLLAIQPADLGPGEGLSEAVSATVDKLRAFLAAACERRARP